MNSPGYRFPKDERCRFRPINPGGLRMVLRVTMRCDLACPHCLSAGKRDGAELGTEEWLTLIRQFPDIEVIKVLLTGGEPLLRTDIVRFVEVLNQSGIATDLNSNLQTMTRSLMQDLKRAGLSEISVSLEGPEEVHDRMHGRPGAYARLIKAVDWAERTGISVDASCCLTRENHHHAADLIEMARELPIRSLTFSRLLPVGHGLAFRQTVTQDHLNKCYRLIQDAAASGESIPIRATGLLGAPRPADCGRGDSLVAMGPDGTLLGCVLSDDNPRIPHPLDVGLLPAWRVLRKELADGAYALCWKDGE